MPATTRSWPFSFLCTKPMSVAQIGRPLKKFFVPSIGSITQYLSNGWISSALPNSSPTILSFGRWALRTSLIFSSTALSASVTGERSGLLSILRS